MFWNGKRKAILVLLTVSVAIVLAAFHDRIFLLKGSGGFSPGCSYRYYQSIDGQGRLVFCDQRSYLVLPEGVRLINHRQTHALGPVALENPDATGGYALDGHSEMAFGFDAHPTRNGSTLTFQVLKANASPKRSGRTLTFSPLDTCRIDIRPLSKVSG